MCTCYHSAVQPQCRSPFDLYPLRCNITEQSKCICRHQPTPEEMILHGRRVTIKSTFLKFLIKLQALFEPQNQEFEAALRIRAMIGQDERI